MVKSFTKAAAAVLLACCIASAGGRNFGIGVVLPMPTGISAKLWTSGTTALDFVIGWTGYHGGYSDSRCYEEPFYSNNRGYCNRLAYDPGYYYNDRYNNGRYYGYRTFHLHGDYLFHNFSAIRSSEKFGLYYGPGINMEFWRYEDAVFGVRGNFGICWLPRRAPMDVFFELAPVINLFPGAFFDVNAGLGTRFYF